jgi:hypothetical protein
MGEELKIKQMIASDIPFGTSHALVEKTKDQGHAHITLTVGDKPYCVLM